MKELAVAMMVMAAVATVAVVARSWGAEPAVAFGAVVVVLFVLACTWGGK